MSKVKSKKHSTFIDMTAMSDVTVLLLTFFMLTSTFLPVEPVQVTTPQSVSEIKIPEYDFMTIVVDPQGKVLFNLDRPDTKVKVLEKMGERYNVSFSDKEKLNFAQPGTFVTVPMGQMKTFLTLEEMATQKEFMKQFNGIPVDSINNQLAQWIKVSKEVNPDLAITIKSDRATAYPMVKNVMSTLQDIKENRFSLVTSLRGMPEGL